MRKCNVCEEVRPEWFFKTTKKKTCRKCEYRWWRVVLRLMVRDKRLTPAERLSSRIGYMGAGFLVAAQWTVSPPFYILGFLCVMVQTAVRKQWNLVFLQLNGLIAWTIHLLN